MSSAKIITMFGNDSFAKATEAMNKKTTVNKQRMRD